MTCLEVQEQLEVLFGVDELPENLRAHLETCADCYACWSALQSLSHNAAQLGKVNFSAAELENMAVSVEQRISQSHITPVISPRWSRVLTRIAAAVLLTATAYTSYLLGSSGFLQGDRAATPDTIVVVSNDSEEELDAQTVSVLIDEYSTSADFGTDEALLNDLSPDEYKYLQEHFSVEDLL